MRYLGPDLSKLSISDDKYSSVITQDMKDVTGRKSIPNLLAASFATSSWKKLNSALNSIKEYTATIGEGGEDLEWPIPCKTIEGYICWAIEKGLKANTVEQYIGSLVTIHKLRNIDSSTCTSFNVDRLLKGAKNREQYSDKPKHTRKVMSLPLLKILGHEIALSEWEDDSKDVIWTAAVLAFFGSLRFGEMLGTGEWKYNPYETLLWSDVKIFENSALLHIKVTKNCSKEGEFVDIFPFPGHGCCPLAALVNLKKSREGGEWAQRPVFAFKSGKLLTQSTFNEVVRSLLRRRIGPTANQLACHSFRGGIPSALASFPEIANDNHVMGWGRWSSSAYLLYTRLKLNQKLKIYSKILSVLEMQQARPSPSRTRRLRSSCA